MFFSITWKGPCWISIHQKEFLELSHSSMRFPSGLKQLESLWFSLILNRQYQIGNGCFLKIENKKNLLMFLIDLIIKLCTLGKSGEISSDKWARITENDGTCPVSRIKIRRFECGFNNEFLLRIAIGIPLNVQRDITASVCCYICAKNTSNVHDPKTKVSSMIFSLFFSPLVLL